MNKSELSERPARRMGVSKALAGDAVDGVFGTISEADQPQALARGDDARTVEYDALGTRNRPARTVRNPGIGKTVENEPAKGPAFKRGTLIDDAENAGGALRVGGGGGGTRNASDEVYVEAVRWR